MFDEDEEDLVANSSQESSEGDRASDGDYNQQEHISEQVFGAATLGEIDDRSYDDDLNLKPKPLKKPASGPNKSKKNLAKPSTPLKRKTPTQNQSKTKKTQNKKGGGP